MTELSTGEQRLGWFNDLPDDEFTSLHSQALADGHADADAHRIALAVADQPAVVAGSIFLIGPLRGILR